MKKIILLAIVIILMCGCSKQECIKSHEEQSRCVYYSYIYNGKTMIPIPHYYDCTKTICDEWKEIKDE